MHSHEIPITIDKKHYKIPEDQNPVKGQKLYELGSVGDNYDLWLRSHGHEDDLLIQPNEDITLKPGMVFYSAKKDISPGTSLC